MMKLGHGPLGMAKVGLHTAKRVQVPHRPKEWRGPDMAISWLDMA